MASAYRDAAPRTEADDSALLLAEARREVRERRLIERKLRLDAILDAGARPSPLGRGRALDMGLISIGLAGAGWCLQAQCEWLAAVCLAACAVPGVLLHVVVRAAHAFTCWRLRSLRVDPETASAQASERDAVR